MVNTTGTRLCKASIREDKRHVIKVVRPRDAGLEADGTDLPRSLHKFGTVERVLCPRGGDVPECLRGAYVNKTERERGTRRGRRVALEIELEPSELGGRRSNVAPQLQSAPRLGDVRLQARAPRVGGCGDDRGCCRVAPVLPDALNTLPNNVDPVVGR